MSTLTLVIGATGKQGGSVTRALLARGERVRALVRNPESDSAKALAEHGVELVTGQMTDRAAVVAAAEGADAIFAMTTPFEKGVEAEVEQGEALIEAAKEAGVKFFLYSSVASADKATGVPHFESKYEVEKKLAESGLAHAIIAPVYFMENLFFPQTLDGVRNGAYAIPMSGEVKLQQIAVENIGEVAASILGAPEQFAGQRFDLAGDEVSAVDAATALAGALDKPVAPVEVPIDQIRSFSEDMALMYEWFVSTGYSVDIPKLHETFGDVQWKGFGDWAKSAVPAAV